MQKDDCTKAINFKHQCIKIKENLKITLIMAIAVVSFYVFAESQGLLKMASLSLVNIEPKQAYAEELTNEVVMRTNNLRGLIQYHTIQFTTTSPGVIASIFMQYQGQGTLADATNSKLIGVSGIGAGTHVPNYGGLPSAFIYNVTAPVNVPAGRTITIMVGDIFSSQSGCYGLRIETQDAAGDQIDDGFIPSVGPNALCNTSPALGQDTVTAREIAGVSRLIFGTCNVNPPPIPDNAHVIFDAPCSLGPKATAPTNVIANPPADFQTGLVAKGSSVNCAVGAVNCNIRVTILNEGSAGGTTFDGPEQVWSYIAFSP
jgi:hypothetical protein